MSSESDKRDKKQSYQFIKNILMHVQDLDKDKQIAYIKKACAPRPELLPSLMNMLNIGNSEFSEIMEKPAILEHVPEVDTQPSNEEPPLPIGTKISQYVIIEQIGSGGMGNVYAAQQNFPAERQVALKLLKTTPNQQLLITETQILARLNHPNIATLFEIDKTVAGQFFIAMELIKGDDIISWCKNKHYSQLQIINLFQQLCAGISYAHEKNIIHCDIKPSNVLVTDIDGSATVKIIDFGISQFEDQQESYHEISGTPAYLAPEVLNGKGEQSTDVRRDVYALGILLKKLLPLTLSIDLHAIIDKATARDKNQRYQTPTELNNDLNRYLKKQTVSARESNIWYVTKLLIQRRFEMVLIVTVVLIFSLISGYVSQYKQAEIATQQAHVAKIAQTEAEELSTFLTDLFNVANPERSNRDLITVTDLLDKAKAKLLAINTPSLSDAKFMYTIGSIYIRMEKLEPAKALIEQSIKVRKPLLDENNSDLIAANIQLGLINKKLGNYSVAEKTLLDLLHSMENNENSDKVKLAYIHNHLGNLYTQINQVDDSIKHHQAAIKLRELQSDKKLLADSYNNLGVIYSNTKQWDLASKYLYLALDLYTQKYNVTHPYIGIAKNNLANVEENRYNWQLSEKLKREVLENFQQSYGDNHKHTISAQRNLALFYNRRLQFHKAINMFNRLALHFESINNLEKAAKYSSLKGVSLARNHQFLEVNQIFKQVMELISTIELKEKYLYAKIHNQYAEVLIIQGDYLTAEKMLNLSLKNLESNYALDNENRLYTLNVLAGLYFKNNQLHKSSEIYKQVLLQNKPTQVSNQIRQVTAHRGLGRIYNQQKLFKQSQTELQGALQHNKKIYGENHKTHAIIYYELAQLSNNQGNTTQAKQLLNQALEIQKRALPAQHKDLLATIDALILL